MIVKIVFLEPFLFPAHKKQNLSFHLNVRNEEHFLPREKKSSKWKFSYPTQKSESFLHLSEEEEEKHFLPSDKISTFLSQMREYNSTLYTYWSCKNIISNLNHTITPNLRLGRYVAMQNLTALFSWTYLFYFNQIYFANYTDYSDRTVVEIKDKNNK